MATAYLLVTGDFVKTGGMDRANFALADYLAKHEKKVTLVGYRVTNELLTYSNVKFHPIPKLANSYLFSSPLLNYMGRFYAQRLAIDGARVIVNGGNCQWSDVNWVHYAHVAYRPKVQAGLWRRWKNLVADSLFLKVEREALQSAKLIIVNSDRTQRDLIENLAIPREKIHRVYYGIDPQVFYPATKEKQDTLRRQLGWSVNKKIVLFIGALGDRRKGFDILFAAWQKLSTSAKWDVELVVIGAGAELTKWEHDASIKNMSSRIRFLGFRTDVPDLLRAADCLVAPTRYEAYGLGVHEALCCGLPALVSITAGVAERYPPELQELLIPDCEDVEDLVTRLQKWEQATEYYRQLVIPLTNELRKYTWDDMAKNIIEHLN